MVGLAIVSSVLAWAATPAAAERTIGTPYIQAHRGGAVVNGEPTYPENTMPAFRHSAAEGFVLELDVKLTKDGPVVIHDATLDRTTDCTGEVASKTLTPAPPLPGGHPRERGRLQAARPATARSASIPTLAQVLDFIKHEGAQANIEIKNQPTDPDFDPTDAFATHGRASAIALQRRPAVAADHPELLAAEPGRGAAVLPDAELSFLTLSAANAGGTPVPDARHTSGSRPSGRSMRRTSPTRTRRGCEIVPYTVDKRGDMVAAAARASTR